MKGLTITQHTVMQLSAEDRTPQGYTTPGLSMNIALDAYNFHGIFRHDTQKKDT